MSAEGTYGSSAVEVIASAIGRTAALLYGYAGIARAWPNAAKFDEIAKESTARKTRLTATHFAVLAGVTDDAKREALRKTCLKSTYSVRALKEHIANSAPKEENSNNVRSVNEHRAVGRLVSVSTSLVKRVEDGLAPLAEGAAAMSPDQLELVLANLTRLRSMTDEAAAKISERLAALKSTEAKAAE